MDKLRIDIPCKVLQLPATLFILSILDSKYLWKAFPSNKIIFKTVNFHCETKILYVYLRTLTMYIHIYTHVCESKY